MSNKSNSPSVADKEKILICHDDFTKNDKSPHLIQGKYLDKNNNPYNLEYGAVCHDQKIVLLYSNINPNLNYDLEVIYYGADGRKMKMMVNNEVIQDEFPLPSIPEKRRYYIEKSLIKNNELKIEFIKVAGENAIVLEVLIYSIGDTIPLETNKKDEDGYYEKEIKIISSIDNTEQLNYVMLPKNRKEEEKPLLVVLHSWGGDYMQKVGAFGPYAMSLGFYAIFPNYRGPNHDNFKALGSKYARQDIVDSVNYMKENYPINNKRIYLVGASGGGHMALLMAGRFPEIWAAISSWVPIVDLIDWHDENKKYAVSIESCLGGPPDEKNQEIYSEYKDRSPVFYIENAVDIPIHLVYSATDTSITARHTERLINKMTKINAPRFFPEKRNIPHSLNPIEMMDFVKKYSK